MYYSIFRHFAVIIWRLIYRKRLQKNNVYLDSGVAFNRNTKFGKYCRVHKGTKINNTQIGSYTYISTNCELTNCSVGSFCSIAANTSIISSTHPTNTFVSTSPVFHSIQNQCGISFVNDTKFQEILNVNGKTVIIGNDVWIGQNATLMGGIVIGDGAIVGACAVVTKDVPPYSIVGGVPAKIIRYRFSKEVIDQLQSDKWWEKPIDWISMHVDELSDINKYIKII